jgi:hypothetical protein
MAIHICKRNRLKDFFLVSQYNIKLHLDSRGRDRMVVGFTTTCAISAYHH